MNLEKLIERYERRARALNVTVTRLHNSNNSNDWKEVSYYSGVIDELEDVIDDLKEELIKK